MKKIPTIFQRNHHGDRLVRDEVTPGTEWVFNGEGKATRKYDGTCCLVRYGVLYRRHEAKGEPPAHFIPAQDPDPITGRWVGWVLCHRDNPNDKWHFEGFDATIAELIARKRSYHAHWGEDLGRLEDNPAELPDGTYELIGPRVQGNPEQVDRHILIRHWTAPVFWGCPRTFNELKEWLASLDIEGVVWHHPDGRMAKIKKKDFGLKRRG